VHFSADVVRVRSSHGRLDAASERRGRRPARGATPSFLASFRSRRLHSRADRNLSNSEPAGCDVGNPVDRFVQSDERAEGTMEHDGAEEG
jgi:hypothetical protein